MAQDQQMLAVTKLELSILSGALQAELDASNDLLNDGVNPSDEVFVRAQMVTIQNLKDAVELGLHACGTIAGQARLGEPK